MGAVNPVGAAGGAGHTAPAAAVQNTQGAAAQRVDNSGGATTNTQDAVHFSDELEEEGGVQGAQHHDDTKPDGTKGTQNPNDPNAAQNNPTTPEDDAKKKAEEKRKQQEEQLRELNKKISDDQAALEDAQKKGNKDEVSRLQNELNDLGAQRDALQKQLQGGDQAKPPGAVPAAGSTPQGQQQAPAQQAPQRAPVQSAPVQSAPQQSAAPQMQSPGGGAPMGGAPMGGAPTGGHNNNISQNTPNLNPSAPINLQGDDKKEADFINNYLKQKGSPAAGGQTGEMMVKYGKQYNVDPLILLSIAGQETQFGKTGVGVNGMLGVGAYDNDPNNSTRNPTFSGVEQQVKLGAQTFAKLRAQAGSSANDSIAQQAAAVNRAGWATDPNWHNGVTAMYAQISGAAQQGG